MRGLKGRGPSRTTWITIECAAQAYHAADWDSANQLLTDAATSDPNPFNHNHHLSVHGRIDPGRGDTTSASQAAERIILYAEGSANNEFLYMGLPLQARCANGYVEAVVSDDGPGVPEDQHQRIFERFVRLDPGKPGHGLGLAIARRIARQHHGDITCDPTPQGARFRLSLPAEP